MRGFHVYFNWQVYLISLLASINSAMTVDKNPEKEQSNFYGKNN